MTDTVILQPVSAADLRTEQIYDQWSDPESIARMTGSKRTAFLCNPLLPGDSETVQIVATHEGRVVGRMDFLSGEFLVGGTRIPTTWGSSLFVSPNARGMGVGLKLVEAMHALKDTVAICGISEMSSRMYDKLHWTRFLIPRYVCLIRSQPLVQRYWGSRPGSGLASMLGDAALSIPRGLAAVSVRAQQRGIRVREAASLPQSLDAALRAPAPVAAPHRSVAWVNWLLENRFDDDPRTRRKLFLLETADGTVRGYFIVKLRFIDEGQRYSFGHFAMGSLQDWFSAVPHELSLTTISLMAMREAASMGAATFAAFLPGKSSPRVLRSLGFLPFPGLDFIYRATPGTLLAGAKFNHPAAWRMRPADGDNFFS